MQIPDHIRFDRIDCPAVARKDITLSIARLDLLHPEVSGNKLFKLHYFAEAALASSHRTILTFGGAYSNHLAATAFFCKEKQLKCIGIVRGEQPQQLSHTLQQCRELGMDLHFTSREQYRNADDPGFLAALKERYGNFILVPEGGYSAEGARGAALINALLKTAAPTHTCVAVGTATTVAGLLRENARTVVAVPVIKGMNDLEKRINFLNGPGSAMPEIPDEYHFGGYAKFNAALIGFMNDFYRAYHVPLDFVYTAKLLYAVTDKIKQGYFNGGSRIVCLHTGGLQGNNSLPAGTLIF